MTLLITLIVPKHEVTPKLPAGAFRGSKLGFAPSLRHRDAGTEVARTRKNTGQVVVLLLHYIIAGLQVAMYASLRRDLKNTLVP